MHTSRPLYTNSVSELMSPWRRVLVSMIGIKKYRWSYIQCPYRQLLLQQFHIPFRAKCQGQYRQLNSQRLVATQVPHQFPIVVLLEYYRQELLVACREDEKQWEPHHA